MKKILAAAIIATLISASAAAALNRAPYPVWFEMLKEKLDDAAPVITNQEAAEIEEILTLKPTVNTGRYYDTWFAEGFRPLLEDVEPVVDTNETKVLTYVLAAKPELKGSERFYTGYLNYMVIKLKDDFLPVLDENEKKLADFMIKAHPALHTESNYEAWLSAYNLLKEDMGPNISPAEQFVLDLLKKIRPDQSGDDTETYYQVSRETLLKIRYLILNNQDYSAVNEIDKILGAGR